MNRIPIGLWLLYIPLLLAPTFCQADEPDTRTLASVENVARAVMEVN